MFLLNAMVPVEYEYEHEYEHEQYHYGTVEFCQSPGKVGGFLKALTVAFALIGEHKEPRMVILLASALSAGPFFLLASKNGR